MLVQKAKFVLLYRFQKPPLEEASSNNLVGVIQLERWTSQGIKPMYIVRTMVWNSPVHPIAHRVEVFDDALHDDDAINKAVRRFPNKLISVVLEVGRLDAEGGTWCENEG